MSFEITPEQRVPGLKNPLTQEQIENLLKGWGPFVEPTEAEIQQVAEELLPKGANRDDLLNKLVDFI